jgi:hypothetical protein
MVTLFFSLTASQNAPNTTVMGTVITSGDDGDYGSVSYSIGQVFYTYIGALVLQCLYST